MVGNNPEESTGQRLSVIIPTLNEAFLLPGLLAAFQSQGNHRMRSTSQTLVTMTAQWNSR